PLARGEEDRGVLGEPRVEGVVELRELRLQERDRSHRDARADLQEHGAQVHLAGDRVRGARRDHEGDGRHPAQVAAREVVEEGLEQSRVRALVDRGSDDDDVRPGDERTELVGARVLGREELVGDLRELGEVHDALGTDRLGDPLRDTLRRSGGARAGTRVADDHDDARLVDGAAHAGTPWLICAATAAASWSWGEVPSSRALPTVAARKISGLCEDTVRALRQCRSRARCSAVAEAPPTRKTSVVARRTRSTTTPCAVKTATSARATSAAEAEPAISSSRTSSRVRATAWTLERAASTSPASSPSTWWTCGSSEGTATRAVKAERERPRTKSRASSRAR